MNKHLQSDYLVKKKKKKGDFYFTYRNIYIPLWGDPTPGTVPEIWLQWHRLLFQKRGLNMPTSCFIAGTNLVHTGRSPPPSHVLRENVHGSIICRGKKQGYHHWDRREAKCERCVSWVHPLEEWNLSGQSNMGLLKGKVMSERSKKQNDIYSSTIDINLKMRTHKA